MARHVLASSLFEGLLREGKALMGYLPLPDEADVEPILEEAVLRGLWVAVPRVEPGSPFMTARALSRGPEGWRVEKGPFGVRQPPPEAAAVPLEEIGVILVPAVAVDEEGYRLGYGKGYYDRFLQEALRLKPGPLLVAVAFQFQVVPELPRAPWDIPCHGLLTEEGLWPLPIPR